MTDAEDSLTRRLAGASVTKAGLALDQSEINRVIAEASKGSKFYENERKKDEELTEKIAKLLKTKDEMLKGANISVVEAGVDKIVAEIEATRDLTQTIVHIDCDAFYASVEVLHDPSLEGKAFGVSPGVLTTASYEARKYGVRSGMPGVVSSFIAKKLCPHLILVPAHFSRYSEMSKQVMDVLRTRDPNMASVSVDEAYLNITEYCNSHDVTPEECVRQLRAEVQEKTKLTVSAGIAPNKMLAKICSDRNKPNGQYAVPFDRDSIIEFMKELPIRKVPGIGKVTERLLQAFDVKTCGDIYPNRAVISLMDHWLGLHSLLHAYLGIASNRVEPYKREERKSIGSEQTFRATSNLDDLLQRLERIAESLEEDLERLGFAGKTITLKYKLDTFKLFTRAKTCSRYITSKDDLFEIGKELLMKEVPVTLRLIGLQASHLKDLRLSEDKGLLKFFAKTSNEAADTGPNKRRKVDASTFITISSDDDIEDEGDDTRPVELAQKPNFFDSDDEYEDEDEVEPVAGPSRTKPHSHAGTLSQSGREDSPPGKAGPTATGKPVSMNSTFPAKMAHGDLKKRAMRSEQVNHSAKENEAATKDTFECPVCGRSLETDNAGLNAHVDFCLSRGTILKASAEASSSGRRPNGNNGAKSVRGKSKAKQASLFQKMM